MRNKHQLLQQASEAVCQSWESIFFCETNVKIEYSIMNVNL